MAIECSVNLANAFVSLGGVALGGLVGFFSARHISTLNTRRQACAAFRAALAPACVELRKTTKPTTSVDDTLKATLNDVAVAFELFSPFVPNSTRASYEIAWREYEDAAKLGSEFMYTDDPDDRVSEVRRRINNLLEHAKFP